MKCENDNIIRAEVAARTQFDLTISIKRGNKVNEAA
jgi:hypothetical protein